MDKIKKACDAMMEAADEAEIVHRALLKARARGASNEIISNLQGMYTNRMQLVNERWDEWNRAILEQRLAQV